jgi:hypothetical protein
VVLVRILLYNMYFPNLMAGARISGSSYLTIHRKMNYMQLLQPILVKIPYLCYNSRRIPTSRKETERYNGKVRKPFFSFPCPSLHHEWISQQSKLHWAWFSETRPCFSAL